MPGRANPFILSINSIIAWLGDEIEDTINEDDKLTSKPIPDIVAEPIVSPTFIEEITNEPPSDANDELSMSGSFGSWLTFMVKSVKLSQSKFESETETVGEKGILDWAIISAGFNKKPKEKINIKFNKRWTIFFFIISVWMMFVVNTCF